jgi:hypothetical protein
VTSYCYLTGTHGLLWAVYVPSSKSFRVLRYKGCPLIFLLLVSWTAQIPSHLGALTVWHLQKFFNRPLRMTMQSNDRQPSLPATTSIHDTRKADPEKLPSQTPSMSTTTSSAIDIEHVLVANDPRKWSSLRKVVLLL